MGRMFVQAKVADLQTEVEDLRTRLLKAEALANAAAGDNYQAVQRQANAHLAKQVGKKQMLWPAGTRAVCYCTVHL